MKKPFYAIFGVIRVCGSVVTGEVAAVDGVTRPTEEKQAGKLNVAGGGRDDIRARTGTH